jgi:hypothetical protein
MSQINHYISKSLECVVHLTYSFKSKKQALELILPCEDPLDGSKPLFENVWAEKTLASSLGVFPIAFVLVDVRNHAAIENCLPIGTTVVYSIKANNGILERYTSLIKGCR